ncbi:hypothetical protein JCM11251_000575 [Rhodosporidiobolus azoricus]
MAPKQYQRPKNPPRLHTSDAVPQRSSSPIPAMPGRPVTPSGGGVIGPRGEQLTPTSSARDDDDSRALGRRSPSPSVSSVGSSTPGGGARSSRKPVPLYNPADEPPLPTSAPRPTNPNPFAAANALIAMREREVQEGAHSQVQPAPPTRPMTPGDGGGRGRSATREEEDKVSPTSQAPVQGRHQPAPEHARGKSVNRRSTSPSSSPPHLGGIPHARPTQEEEDDLATLNFARRPSQFDPLAPSFHPSHLQGSHPPQAQGSSGQRSLLPVGGGGAGPTTPTRAHHRSKSSHTRQPSISLSSPSSSPLPSPGFAPASGQFSQLQQQDRKILPLQPAARQGGGSGGPGGERERVPPTRAPIEAFASVEMLQGMREASERTRGTEVFGPGGKYEGRASSISEQGGLPAYSRRPAPDPLSNVHAARNPLAAHHHQQHGGAPQIPPIHALGGAGAEADVFSIANQLREHDKGRRGSEVDRGDWPRRFSSASSADDDESPPGSAAGLGSGGGTHKLNPHFSFPARAGTGTNLSSVSLGSGDEKGSKTPAPAYGEAGGLQSAFDDDDESTKGASRYPPDFKSFFTGGGGRKRGDEKRTSGGGWRTEHLGTSPATLGSSSLAQPRPSIVALPVYPSPGGSVSRSFKTRAKKIATKVCILTGFFAIAATWMYLYLRLEAMRAVERKRPGVFVGGWAFLTLETVVAFMTSIHILWTTLTYRSRTSEPKMRLRGDANLPSVDVFIVASGQADQTVFDCAVASASMDYPPHRYRVMVLDATGSVNLEKQLASHAKSQACPHLTYHRRVLGPEEEKKEQLEGGKRKKGEKSSKSKANSINFGMVEASSFGIKGPAEFIAVFDADMIPERNYLRAVLPHILTSAKTALVKTRHGFINLPHRLSQAASTLYTASETPADTRSGFLLRRAALSEIGGFPADSWIHDGQCEALLLGRGYKVHQVDEVLQWGMAKPTYTAQINAMMVNRLGPLRTAHRLGWFMWGEKTRLMPFAARCKAVGRALLPIFSVIMILLAYVYPFMFSFGGILVLTPNLTNLNHLLQATLLMLLLSKLHESLWCWSTGLPSPRRSLQTWIFAAPYQGFALVRLFLPRKLGGYRRGTDLDINEVIAHPEREIWYKRVFWFALDPMAGTMFGFLAALGVAIWRIVKEYEHGTVDEHQTALTVLLTVAWPTLLWLEFVFAAFVPFVCMLFPSRLLTEPRESFLIRDHYSSVARPKHHFKTASPFKVHRAPEFISGTLVISWAIVCVCVAKLTDVLA